jgi:hypothetical protein
MHAVAAGGIFAAGQVRKNNVTRTKKKLLIIAAALVVTGGVVAGVAYPELVTRGLAGDHT